MKVRELIEKLQQMPHEWNVMYSTEQGPTDVEDVHKDEYYSDQDGRVAFVNLSNVKESGV